MNKGANNTTFIEISEIVRDLDEQGHSSSKTTISDPRLERKQNLLDINGLLLVDNFISIEEESLLLSCIDKEKWNTLLKRRTQHYGYMYNYLSKGISAETRPIPSWCDYIIDRLLEQKILAIRPDQMIVNEYTPGQGINPHVDDTYLFEDGIVSLSLGSKVTMDLLNNRNTSNKKEITLPRRSIVSFHDEARYDWRHGIAARKKDHGVKRGKRLSLTFRKVKNNQKRQKLDD
jgi:alkylated DNA repair dioxygenase AlkB